jgi:antirestriction protein ArdC
MRYYTVFNLSQTENIDMKKLKTQQNNNNQSIITAEEAIANWQNKPEIVHRGSQPCYIPARDIIEIPDKKFFTSADSYYQTFYHEAVHSTGHKSRSARKEVMETSLFRGAEYGLEELVAEVGACFLSSATGIKADIDNTAAYVKSWLRVLNDDPKMIITAAARAEKAMDHILGTAPEPAETQE